MLYSLYLGLLRSKENVIVSYSDIYFSKSIIKKLKNIPQIKLFYRLIQTGKVFGERGVKIFLKTSKVLNMIKIFC